MLVWPPVLYKYSSSDNVPHDAKHSLFLGVQRYALGGILMYLDIAVEDTNNGYCERLPILPQEDQRIILKEQT